MTEKFLMLWIAIGKFLVDKVATVLGYVRERKWRTWCRRVAMAKKAEILLCANCHLKMLARDVILWNRDGRPIHDEHTPHFVLENSTRTYCRFVGTKSSGDYDEVGVESGWHTQAHKPSEPNSVRFSRVSRSTKPT